MALRNRGDNLRKLTRAGPRANAVQERRRAESYRPLASLTTRLGAGETQYRVPLRRGGYGQASQHCRQRRWRQGRSSNSVGPASETSLIDVRTTTCPPRWQEPCQIVYIAIAAID